MLLMGKMLNDLYSYRARKFRTYFFLNSHETALPLLKTGCGMGAHYTPPSILLFLWLNFRRL